jgi:hypothetical protein
VPDNAEDVIYCGAQGLYTKASGQENPSSYFDKHPKESDTVVVPDNDFLEVGDMTGSDVVTRGEFDAHMKRIDEGIRHIDERMSDRFSSLDEKLDYRFSSLNTNIERLTDTIVEQRKEIHSDNMATRMTNYAVLATAVLGFLALLLTLLR